MATPSEVLTPDEEAEAAHIMHLVEIGEARLRDIVAEVILWRRAKDAIRKNAYLCANPSVKKELDRMPGSRSVPAAYLPKRK